MATGAEYQVVRGILRIDFSQEKAKVILYPKSNNTFRGHHYANLLHIGIDIQNVQFTQTQIVIDNKSQDGVVIQWPNNINLSGVVPEVLKANTVYVLGLEYFGGDTVVGKIVEGDRNTYEEVDDIYDSIKIIEGDIINIGDQITSSYGLTHTETLNLLSSNNGETWTYIGEGSTYKVYLPYTGDLSNEGLLIWEIILYNLSIDKSDITIHVVNPTNLIDTVLSIPYTYGSKVHIKWNLDDTFTSKISSIGGLGDWFTTFDGDLIPTDYGKFLGNAIVGPKGAVFHTEISGVRGLLLALDTSLPHFLPYITLVGNNVGVIGDPIDPRANAPAVIWAEPIMLKSDSGVLWGFGTQGSIPPASIQDHYMVFGPVQNTSDGDQFSQIVIGPQLEFLFEDIGSSGADFNVKDNQQIVVSHAIANPNAPYVDPSSISFSVFIENLASKDTIFDIRMFHQGIEIYAHPLITLQGNNQQVSFNLPLAEPPLPFNLGDTIDLRVEGISTNAQSQAFVKGTIELTTIRIKQEPIPVVFGSEIGALGIDSNYSNQYRITDIGPHTLDDIYEWRSRGINTIAFKNSTTSDVKINAAVGDVFDWRKGFNTETSITIPAGDALVLGVVNSNVWEVLALSSNKGAFLNATKYSYVQAGLPFTTGSIIYVIASTSTTPILEKGQYKLTINGSFGCTAANRSFNVILLIDGVQINTTPYIKEPKDINDRFPISYTYIIDWSALTATHDVEIQIKKDGGGGGADVQLHDWRYQIERWSD